MLDPTNTSAVFLVPQWGGRWENLTAGMQKIKDFPKGYPLYVNGKHTPVLLQVPMVALYDPPGPELEPEPEPAAASTDEQQNAGDPLGIESWTHLYAGHVAGIPVKVLLDSGAYSQCLLDERVAEEHGLTAKPGAYAVKLPNGKDAHVIGTCTATLKIGSFYETIRFHVMGLSDQFDVILGDHWLKAHKAIMNWNERSCILYRGHKKFKIDHMGRITKQFDAGVSQTARADLAALHAEDELFLVMVSAVDEGAGAETSSMDAAIQSLVTQYADVFPGELPAGLPPHRNTAHTIPMMPGAGTPYKAMYWLSPAELAEMKAQVTELLGKGLIESSALWCSCPVCGEEGW